VAGSYWLACLNDQKQGESDNECDGQISGSERLLHHGITAQRQFGIGMSAATILMTEIKRTVISMHADQRRSTIETQVQMHTADPSHQQQSAQQPKAKLGDLRRASHSFQYRL
jgi:hypothetical protein